ncbi:MAG: small ribosomal subunit Rsm22 family protein [Treponema sp.]|nr:small ribosomal subunit Rsm22 family protein [Treponema sp.]
MRNLFAPLPRETRRLLDGVPAIIDKAFPLPGRFRSKLPSDVAELSRLLTSGRGQRGLSYLGRPNLLSAYLRFFLPWNLYRLCRLLPSLDITLRANDVVTDLGCGPFTFAAALWICRPDLRQIPLEFQCIDRSGPVLEAGRKFFAALTGATLTSATPVNENNTWKIRALKTELGTGAIKPAALVCAANVFNEMYGDISRCNTETLKRNAEKSARLLENYALAESAVLVVEPGFPRCGEFIALLRNALMERSHQPLAPCSHDGDCPLLDCTRAGKKRWCHFAFETEDAPRDLQRLSSSARLPKERAVLSFVFMGKPTAPPGDKVPAKHQVRIISDAFPLPRQRFGRYGCSRQGLVLLAGEEGLVGKTGSGALVNAAFKKGERDAKSGALLAEYR